jgi:hypothetical protein
MKPLIPGLAFGAQTRGEVLILLTAGGISVKTTLIRLADNLQIKGQAIRRPHASLHLELHFAQ